MALAITRRRIFCDHHDKPRIMVGVSGVLHFLYAVFAPPFHVGTIAEKHAQHAA